MQIGILAGAVLAIAICLLLYFLWCKQGIKNRSANAMMAEHTAQITNNALERIRDETLDMKAQLEADHDIKPVSTQVNKSEYRHSVRKR